MFGHDDNHKQDDNHQPQHDGVLDDGTVSLPASDTHTDHHQSPAFTGAAPVHHDDHADMVGPAVAGTHTADDDHAAPTDHKDDLIDIKQEALKQLTPLVGHLDQTPEEKFRTTMMMIQASDNQALIKEAYASAQAITDEKARAQALLDIVNEINYFTHQ